MKKSEQTTPNALLRHAREQRGWSREYVAEKIGSDPKSLGRWERGVTFPQPYYRQKLCELFEKNAQELGLMPGGADKTDKAIDSGLSPRLQATLPEASGASQPPAAPILSIWNVPYRRNPFFTGREAALNALHAALTHGKAIALTQAQAISGLGGVGKTQTAVEYAYRYHDAYKAILWARADSHETLVSDVVSMVTLLKLPEKDEQDQNRVLDAFKRWLQENDDWLLILDNADDLMMVNDFLPSLGQGHILLTTREQVTGRIAQRIEIEKMEPEEGALFLLRRTHKLAIGAPRDNVSYTYWNKAIDISRMLDGLPLALDQAGAYIEQTECGLAGYLDRYQKHRSVLLGMRGPSVSDHPEPVATTWALSFEKVQTANPAAADLLRFCAFLHPDAIPLEIITDGASELGPLLEIAAADLIALDMAIGELRRFSLLRRDPENQILNIHRLVQAVIKDGMDQDTQRRWAERVVRAVNRVFPDGTFETWQACERCLPQAQVCAALIKQRDVLFEEAGQLLSRMATYLQERARYAEAKSLYYQALEICEKTLGPEDSKVAQILDALAVLYFYQGKYSQAESIEQRALAIREKVLGLDHPDVADSLNNLATICQEQGKYTQAEPLFQRALDIWERKLGPEHRYVASALSNLGLLYYVQGKYAEAEPLYIKALSLNEQTLGLEHPEVAYKLHNLAMLYRMQGRYVEAEPLFVRALLIREQALEPDHPDMALSLNNLGGLYRLQVKYDQAEPLLLRALSIRESKLGLEHHHVSYSLADLGLLYYAQGKYSAAEPLLRRALAIRKQVLGSVHPDVAEALENYADLLQKMNRQGESAELDAQARTIRAKYAEEHKIQ